MRANHSLVTFHHSLSGIPGRESFRSRPVARSWMPPKTLQKASNFQEGNFGFLPSFWEFSRTVFLPWTPRNNLPSRWLSQRATWRTCFPPLFCQENQQAYCIFLTGYATRMGGRDPECHLLLSLAKEDGSCNIRSWTPSSVPFLIESETGEIIS